VQASQFRWEDQFNLSLDPETARAFHDETPSDGRGEISSFLLDVWTSLLQHEDNRGMSDAMQKRTQFDKSTAIEHRLRQKAAEFQHSGAEIYSKP